MEDELTGLTYLRARYYNPAAGRFTQEDVIYDDGFNLYAYCGSNPVIYCDPSGFAKNNKCEIKAGTENGAQPQKVTSQNQMQKQVESGRAPKGVDMLNWQEQKKNAYPNIILSDCTIDEIYVDNQNIILKFLKRGFVIRDNENSKYYRTKSAQIVIKECDIDNILIQYVYVKKRRGHKVIKIIKDVEFSMFLKNVLNHKWKYEIVEEYYSELGGLFIGKIKDIKSSMWCSIKFQYKDIIYFWDEINYDAVI